MYLVTVHHCHYNMNEINGDAGFVISLRVFWMQVINVTGFAVGMGLASAFDTLISQVQFSIQSPTHHCLLVD